MSANASKRVARAVACALALLLAVLAVPAAADHSEPLNEKKQRKVRGERVPYLQHSDSRPSLIGGTKAARRARIAATPPAGQVPLASTWCGTEQTSENGDLYAKAPRIKLIYAYPADRANRFVTYAPTIQANAKTASDQVAAENGNLKTLRFDVGTSCGSEYADILSFRLPDARSAYYTAGGDVDIDAVVADLPLSSPSGSIRNYAVYLDHLDDPYAAGLGYLPLDDTHGPSNDTNAGGWGAFLLGASAFDAHVLLHEIGHTLGAVQDSAPHSSGAGHCTDEYDVMCYSDGGPGGPLTFPCAPPERFDCGGDDYLDPTPAASSYLATHWNLYDSAFLCTIGDGGCLQRHATVQLSNGDDSQTVALNGHQMGSAGFAETKTVDLGFLTDRDEIVLETRNAAGSYAWGYDVFVDGLSVLHDMEGIPGGPGANGNDQSTTDELVHRVTTGAGGTGGSGGTPPGNQPPTVAIAATTEHPVVGQVVAFRSEAFDSDGTIAARAWDLDGDGQFDDATGTGAARSFPAGTFTVRMRVTDDDGASADAALTLAVVASPETGTPGTSAGTGATVSTWCADARKRRDALSRSVRSITKKLKKRMAARKRRSYKRRLSSARSKLKRAQRDVKRLC